MADGAHPLKAATTPAPAEPRLRRFSRAEFDAMVAAGILEEGGRVELIGGEIVDMPGEGFAHADSATYLSSGLWRALGGAFDVVMNTRLDVDDETEAYPDIMVVQAGTPTRQRNPETVLLLIEIDNSSIRHDRDRKGPRYAAAGFREYWIHEPETGRLWVHREPAPDGVWGAVVKLEAGGEASPLFAPEARVLLPPAFVED